MPSTASGFANASDEMSCPNTYFDLQIIPPTEDLTNFFPNIGEVAENFNDIEIALDPHLEIIIQPIEKFRFRYASEKGSHGGITGKCKAGVKKCYPTVWLHNLPSTIDPSTIIVKVSVYTSDDNPCLHVIELVGKNCKDGVKLDTNFTATFPSLGILNKKKEEVVDILTSRKKKELAQSNQKCSKKEIARKIQEEAKGINLNSVKLCFEAYHEDNLRHPICHVLSDTIYNLKSTSAGDLRIIRISRWTGRSSGGEDVIILCDKVKKDDIQIQFYEEDKNGEMVWSDFGVFLPTDVHYQVAIPFKTPSYKENAERNIKVCLIRPSDGKHGEAVEFHFIPDEYDTARKRKRPNSMSSTTTSSDSTQGSSGFASEGENSPSMSETDEACPELNDLYSFFMMDTLLDANATHLIPNWAHEKVQVSEKAGVGQDLKIDASEIDMSSLSIINKLESIPETPGHLPQYSRSKLKKQLFKGSSEEMLIKVPQLLRLQDMQGNSVLHLAVTKHSVDLVNQILQFCSENVVNHQNKFRETSLHLACYGNSSKIIKLLLLRGGNPNIPNQDGDNCFHIVAKNNSMGCLKLLVNFDPVMLKPELNSYNYDGLVPLHLAITEKSRECAKLLLHAGANINAREKKCGSSALHLAIEMQPSMIWDLLTQPDLDLHCKNFKNATPLEVACGLNDIAYEALGPEIKNNIGIIEFLKNLYLNGNHGSGLLQVNGNCDSEMVTSESDEEDEYESCPSSPVFNGGCQGDSDASEIRDEISELHFSISQKLCDYLDVTSKWKIIAELSSIDKKDISIIAQIGSTSSPSRALLGRIISREWMDLNDTSQVDKIVRNLLEMAGIQFQSEWMLKN